MHLDEVNQRIYQICMVENDVGLWQVAIVVVMMVVSVVVVVVVVSFAPCFL